MYSNISCASEKSIRTVIRQIKQAVLSAFKVVQHDVMVALMASDSIFSLRFKYMTISMKSVYSAFWGF